MAVMDVAPKETAEQRSTRPSGGQANLLGNQPSNPVPTGEPGRWWPQGRSMAGTGQERPPSPQAEVGGAFETGGSERERVPLTAPKEVVRSQTMAAGASSSAGAIAGAAWGPLRWDPSIFDQGHEIIDGIQRQQLEFVSCYNWVRPQLGSRSGGRSWHGSKRKSGWRSKLGPRRPSLWFWRHPPNGSCRCCDWSTRRRSSPWR